MRIWDINPGYLNRQSLLGEHRELHGMVSIFVNGKKGYSTHPETRRWHGYGWALKQRHKLLAAEMALRGYSDKTPVGLRAKKASWPDTYIDEPYQQFRILQSKYRDKDKGRIALPGNIQQLWSQHKYSVLARDERRYRKLGKWVAAADSSAGLVELAREVTVLLRQAPSAGGMRNALLHMWGHVSDFAPVPRGAVNEWSSARLLNEIQQRTLTMNERYLLSSTALGELVAWS